jgi:hypothetical protein
MGHQQVKTIHSLSIKTPKTTKRKMNRAIFAAIKWLACLALLSAISFAKAQNPIKSKNKSDCRAIEYTIKYYDEATTTETPIINFWFYDELGRLVKDSCVYRQPHSYSEVISQSFEYKGDSIINRQSDGDTNIIKLTKDGLPLLERLPFGVTYNAYYLENGDLKKMTVVQPVINKRGLLDSIVIVSDSIIYSGENIIAFRVQNIYPKEFSPLPSVIQHFTVKCSYYDAQIRSTEFYPVGKLTGLSNNPMQNFGSLNVSLFSKSLIRKMESPSGSLEFVFQFNDKGRVIGFERHFSSFNAQQYNSTDYSSIKYDCGR